MTLPDWTPEEILKWLGYSVDPPPTVTCQRCGAVSSYFLKTYPTEQRRYCPGCKNTLTQHPRAKKP